ncbi:DUF3526 domain-containing protein [Pedobacter jamesrossensis]|uniref:DUF3526 domain-containing protein n=1 Tax=Pedobacter jamesrossensis TaxID=1908238 RepID=A0ABV8NPV0_9SPHI
MGIVTKVIKKEFLSAFRDRQVTFALVIIISLFTLGGIGGFLNYGHQKKQIEILKKEKRDQWLGQGNKHPHIAAHYGTFVFKPKTGLSFFDFGLDAYTGSSIYLEAHYQHEFMFRQAQDFGAMIRFGELSIALILQLLVPLLIIFLCFSAFVTERENGTLRILASQGVSMTTVAWGKILAYFSLVSGLLLLTFAILFGLVFMSPQFSLTADTLARIGVIALAYLAYFFVFICLSVVISYRSKYARNALLSLLVVWILFTIIVPKTTANFASNLYKLPSLAIYEKSIADDISSKILRNPTQDTLITNFRDRLLKKYQVNDVNKLPLNFEGAYAQVYEEFGNKIHDVHSDSLLHKIQAQNRLSTFMGFIDPFLAVRNLSMTMASTDFNGYTDFQKKAEDYRRYLVKQMNADYRDHSHTGEFYEYKADKTLWGSIHDFRYTVPDLKISIGQLLKEIFALLIWVIISVIVVNKITKKTIL